MTRRLDGLAAAVVLMMLSAGAVGLRAQDLTAAIRAYESGDAARAFQLLKPLAAAGDGRAEYYLGLLYRDGRGTARDLVQAYVHLNRSGSRTHDQAGQARTARDELEARLSPEDLARAQSSSDSGAPGVEISRPAVSAGDRAACAQLVTIAGLVARQSIPPAPPPLEWGRSPAIVLFDRDYSDKRVEATIIFEHSQVAAITELLRSCALVDVPGTTLTLFDKDDYFHLTFGSVVVTGAVDVLRPTYARSLQRWVRSGVELTLSLE